VLEDGLVIKYLGSKRTLVPLIGKLAAASGASSALDLFTGTTRVAHALKSAGMQVTAVDTASYSKVFADTWIALDKDTVPVSELSDAIKHLATLPGESGYFTQSFCLDARYFQPHNGERIDAIRNAIETDYRGSWLYEPLLAALILAADKVDSTTGMQMAYLKQWSKRSFNQLKLSAPELLPGTGTSLMGDAVEISRTLPPVDLAYLDPPYNQHRYFGNYHIWETLVRWDSPETYGIANKRIDVRGADNRSAFNSKRTMPAAVADLVASMRAETLILSYNNESWLSKDELISICASKGEVAVIDVDFQRYIGSQIGIYNKQGTKVGAPGRSRNLEHLVIAGDKQTVRRMIAAGKS
jgi:adenine-specific DNA-methyltransferase